VKVKLTLWFDIRSMILFGDDFVIEMKQGLINVKWTQLKGESYQSNMNDYHLINTCGCFVETIRGRYCHVYYNPYGLVP